MQGQSDLDLGPGLTVYTEKVLSVAAQILLYRDEPLLSRLVFLANVFFSFLQ